MSKIVSIWLIRFVFVLILVFLFMTINTEDIAYIYADF
jgi:uncharacterized integral membrane protein